MLAAIALGTLVLALTAIRNQTFFGFAGSLLAADTLARSNVGRAPALSPAFSRVTAAALAAAALIGVGLIAAEPGGKFESLVPVRAIDAAAALAARHPGARVLADEWSSPPLLWLHPAMFGRVGFDARLEQYSVAQLNAYATFLSARAPGWQRLLRGYRIVVVSRQHHDGLASALARLPGWRVAYAGRDGLVLERGSPRLPRRRPVTTSNASAGCAWQYRAQYIAVEVTWSGSRKSRTSSWAVYAPAARAWRRSDRRSRRSASAGSRSSPTATGSSRPGRSGAPPPSRPGGRSGDPAGRRAPSGCRARWAGSARSPCRWRHWRG